MMMKFVFINLFWIFCTFEYTMAKPERVITPLPSLNTTSENERTSCATVMLRLLERIDRPEAVCTCNYSSIEGISRELVTSLDELREDNAEQKRRVYILTQKINRTEGKVIAIQTEQKEVKEMLLKVQENVRNVSELYKDLLQKWKTVLPLLKALPGNCEEVYASGNTESGVYTIDPGCGDLEPFPVFCNMTNGHWITFQRQMIPSENFYRNWSEYENGFGQLNGSHWLGLKYLHCLARPDRNASLRIDMVNTNGISGYAQYSIFSINDAVDKYRIHIDSYSGNVPDTSRSQDANPPGRYSIEGQQFSTYDQKNDNWPTRSCAVVQRAGWWFNQCMAALANGRLDNEGGAGRSIYWNPFRSGTHILQYIEMKLRF